MAYKKSWFGSKHTAKERRAYNIGYALGITGTTSDSLSRMYDERKGSVGRSSDECIASLKGFNRGYRHFEKGKK